MSFSPVHLQHDQRSRLAHRHGLQQQAVHRREQRRRRADADRQRQQHHQRPALGLRTHPNSVLEVVQHGCPVILIDE